MNIDWDELNKGAASEMEKVAWNINPFDGFGAVSGLKNMAGGIMDQVGKLLPLGIAAMSGGGKAKAVAPRPSGGAVRTLLPDMAGQVGSISHSGKAIMGYAPPPALAKVAATGIESVVWAARNRVANSILNQVTKTNPLAMQLPSGASATDVDRRKIELTSKYPEMQELLENPENQEYLERLLSEEA